MLTWFWFVLCAVLILYSGSRLSRYGDVIAEKTGLGRAWIGLFLMASVTSLPEMVTGISSVTYADLPDIAVGNVLGACVFNMLTLALLDGLARPMPLSTKAHHGHVLSGGFGILMICIVSIGLMAGSKLPPLGWIGTYTVLIVVIYLGAIRLLYFYEKRQLAALVKGIFDELKYRDISTKSAVIRYVAHAAVVIAVAIFLPMIGQDIARQTGLGTTFVGNIFIAFSTTLPEIVVSYAAIRIGAVDLAIGNLFGSNIFNIFILALDDLFFIKGSILSHADPGHIIPALSAILMTSIAIIGLTYRAEKKPLFLAWDAIGILVVYMANVMLLYAMA